jgi:hypothetical protein
MAEGPIPDIPKLIEMAEARLGRLGWLLVRAVLFILMLVILVWGAEFIYRHALEPFRRMFLLHPKNENSLGRTQTARPVETVVPDTSTNQPDAKPKQKPQIPHKHNPNKILPAEPYPVIMVCSTGSNCSQNQVGGNSIGTVIHEGDSQ